MLALPLGAQLVFLHLYQSVSSLLKRCRLLVLSGWSGTSFIPFGFMFYRR